MPIEMPCVCPGCGDVYELNDLVVRSANDDLTCVGCRDAWRAMYDPDDEESSDGQ
jgi:hypothetical protein